MNNYQPRYVGLRKAVGVPGEPISDLEPYLVIRAGDVLAISMANAYLKSYADIGGDDPRIIAQLISHQQAIADWQRGHGSKVADRADDETYPLVTL